MTPGRIRKGTIYRAIQELSGNAAGYTVKALCALGRVTRAAYYKWLRRKPSMSDEMNSKVARLAEKIHEEHPDKGYRRIRDSIRRDYGLLVNDKRVLRICRIKNLRSVVKGRHNCCTRPASDPYYTAENVLNRDFHADMFNTKWLTDVTEFKYITEAGEIKKLYLSAILDLCDRRIVAYAIGDSNNNKLVFRTFDEAATANPDAHPIFHSDRGYQYTNKAFRAKITKAGMTQSMSRVAFCLDNAPMEGFWGILKREVYYRRRFTSRPELVKAIKDYIKYYNYDRPQRGLGILTPNEYHEKLAKAA